MNFKENLQEIIEVLKDIVPLREAYLFGSFAYGIPDNNSDFDLYLVVEEYDRKYETLVEIYSAIDKIKKRPVDILLNTKEYFDKRKEYCGTLEYKIFKEGIKLYE